MGYYVSFDGKGRPLQTGYAPDGREQAQAPGAAYTELTTGLVNLEGIYSDSIGSIKQIPPQPSQLHEWSWDTHTWELTQTSVGAFKASLKSQVNDLRNNKVAIPIAYDGDVFDVDSDSMETMSYLYRRLSLGYPLPTGWTGWRTHTNNMVLVTSTPSEVMAKLDGLFNEVDGRRQLLYLASWDHKDQIDSITDASQLLAYDITANWP